MDSADPAGAHEAKPDRARDRERPTDGRRADDALHDCSADVARPELARGRAEALELRLVEADAHLSVEHADRRGRRAGLAHAPLALEPDRDTLAGRKAVRDQRRLERDDRPALVERGAHLVGELDHRFLLHLDERDLAPAIERPDVLACSPERGALVDRDRALVERGDVQRHAAAGKPIVRERDAVEEELEAEALSGQVGPKAEADLDGVLPRVEVVEPDDLVAVSHDEEALGIQDGFVLAVVEVVRRVVAPAVQDALAPPD